MAKQNGAAPQARFLPCGDTALVVEFGTQMDRHLSALVLNLSRRVASASLPGVGEAVPTFRSLMVHYDPLVLRAHELETQLKVLINDLDAAPLIGQRWCFPTCYEGEEFAPDLVDVAVAAGMGTDEVVALHASVEHLVYMLGFLPGQAYMGDPPARLTLPRRASPRLRVAPGSVATAIGQTTVYPFESPGGWHILGRTAVPLFNATWEIPALLAPGDTVQFRAVSRAEFEETRSKCAEGSFDLDSLKVAP